MLRKCLLAVVLSLAALPAMAEVRIPAYAVGTDSYVKFSGATGLEVDMAPGGGDDALYFIATNSSINTAGLAAGTYAGLIFEGTVATSDPPNDEVLGVISGYVFGDTAEVVESEQARDAILGATLASYNTAGTVGQAVNWLKAAFASSGVFSPTALADAGGTSQPRVNLHPSPAFTRKISNRADGTARAALPINLTAGAVGDIAVFIDMAPLFGPNIFVKTVTSAAITGGSVTPTGLGPRDTYAVVELDGTATAGEERTVTATVTMETLESVVISFTVKGIVP